MNKELLLGSGAAVLAVAGIYYAIKSSSQQSQAQQTAPSGYSTMSPYASYTPASSGSDTVNTATTPVATAQTGDLTSVLATDAATANLNAQANFQTGTLNAINAQSATVLARGADLAGRGAGTLNLDYSQQSTANGAPVANGTNTASPIATQMTAHLSETVPDQHYAPLPVQNIVQPYVVQAAAPAPVQSSGGGGCFITTAICKAFNVPDDEHNTWLTTLRQFRDSYMSETAERRSLVEDYYRIAPAIALKLTEHDCFILTTRHLIHAVMYARRGDNEKAMKIYSQMVEHAKILVA